MNSSTDRCSVGPWRERNRSHNRAPLLQLRLDRQSPAYELQPFLHAGEPESPAGCRSGVEADAFVPHGESERVASSLQLHRELAGSTVPYGVVQRFLHHPEETERDLGRYSLGNILVAEIHFHFLLRSEERRGGKG